MKFSFCPRVAFFPIYLTTEYLLRVPLDALAGWMDRRTGDFDNYAQRVTSGGTIAASWPTDGDVICDVAGMQIPPFLVPDGSHGAVAVWYDFRDPLYPQLYTARVLADMGALSTRANFPSARRPPSSAGGAA